MENSSKKDAFSIAMFDSRRVLGICYVMGYLIGMVVSEFCTFTPLNKNQAFDLQTNPYRYFGSKRGMRYPQIQFKICKKLQPYFMILEACFQHVSIVFPMQTSTSHAATGQELEYDHLPSRPGRLPAAGDGFPNADC